jgi:hypothetical protein
MKQNITIFTIVILTVFGLLTLFLSSSVIFDLFGIREKEGNFVLFIVWANFISSILYLLAALSWIRKMKIASTLLGISTAILALGFVGLLIHVKAGGLHETKTIGAMFFRTLVTLLFTLISIKSLKKNNYDLKN